MKTCCLTFDDATESQFTVVRHELNRRGLKGTFFVTGADRKSRWGDPNGEGLALTAHGEPVEPKMAWNQVKILHDEGHEIGNHTWSHQFCWRRNQDEVREDIAQLNRFLWDVGITGPVSFCYPAFDFDSNGRTAVMGSSFKLARTGGKEAWRVGMDPFAVPTFASFAQPLDRDRLSQIKDGEAAVFAGHGFALAERKQVLVNLLDWLVNECWRVVPLRDLF